MTPDSSARFARADEGHLFVVRADLLGLDCDAWLLPTDEVFRVESPWHAAVGLRRPGHLDGIEWPRRKLAMRFSSSEETKGEPLVVLGRVGLPADTPVAEGVLRASAVARAFVQVAAQVLRSRKLGRRPRLALPLIGTGAGGLAGAPGDLLVPLIDAIEDAVRDHDVDVVLAVVDDLAWSAAQEARHRRADPSDWELSQDLVTLAQKLADQARDQHLVLFLGAGVSRDAGLPEWTGLLDRVAAAAGLSVDAVASLRELDPRDRARLLEREVGSRDAFIGLVGEELSTSRFGLTHALLASLRAEAAVTTNFDELYERACTLPGDDRHRPAQLPYEPAVAGRPWLLKLHGDLARSDIVLTRPDYLGAERERGALFGIVQAMLVTRHLLFVGYSLSDEDFHRLVDEIGAALGEVDQHHLGTVLAVDDPAWRELWTGALDIVTPSPDQDPAWNARELQILLDLVNHLAAERSSHLLDRRFQGLLSDCESDVADHLRQLDCLMRSCLPEDSALRATLDALLASLGHGSEEPPSVECLRAHHCDERVDRVPGDPAMTAFKRRARLQQALWREAMGLLIGHEPMRPRSGRIQRELGSRIEVDAASAHQWNLMSDAARRAAKHRLANPQRHQALNEDRLWANALGSMPVCWSVFGPLTTDFEVAGDVVTEWFPCFGGTPTAVHLEWSPGRRDPAFLGDRTAFDAAIETELPDGSSGIIGFETKYHEHVTVERRPTGPHLDRLLEVHERSGFFRPGAADEILGTELQQLWRDHLLVLSMLQHTSGTWTRGQYVLVHPEGNVSFASAALRYRSLLKDTCTFSVIALEEILKPDGPFPAALTDPIRTRYLW